MSVHSSVYGLKRSFKKFLPILRPTSTRREGASDGRTIETLMTQTYTNEEIINGFNEVGSERPLICNPAP